MGVQLHGHEARQGETVFAFFVLRFATPTDRAGLRAALEHVASLVPDAGKLIAELPADLEEPMQIVSVPWAPPEPGPAVAEQRRSIATLAEAGVEAAWFFQTGTRLPSDADDDEDEEDDEDVVIHDDDDDDDDDDEDDDEDDADDAPSTVDIARPRTMTDGWGDDDVLAIGDVTDRQQLNPHDAGDETSLTRAASKNDEDDDDDGGDVGDDDDASAVAADASEALVAADDGDDEDDEDDEDDDDLFDDDIGGDTWTHGPPPQVVDVEFPVDNFAQYIDEYDWQDVGVAFKMRGPYIPGEATVLRAFHALWLAPYAGHYRMGAVTIDRAHHSAHFWVDRFLVTTDDEEQVRHLLWVVSKLHEVIPVVNAHFAGASMEQKYGELVAERPEPFVLGGNPLAVAFRKDGEAGVDAWLAEQTDWSTEEIARMLVGLARGIATGSDTHGKFADDEVDSDDDLADDDLDDDELDDDDDLDDDELDGDDDRDTTDDARAARSSDGADVSRIDDDADDGDDDDSDADIDALFEAAGMTTKSDADDDDDDEDVGDDADDTDDGDDDGDEDVSDDADDGDDRDNAGQRPVGAKARGHRGEVRDHDDEERRERADRDDDDDVSDDGDGDDDHSEDVRAGDDDDSDDDDLDRGRYIATYAGELLAARARAGLLDPRVADALRPVLAQSGKFEHRRKAVVSILGALRDRASVPAMIQILGDNPIKSSLDSISKEEFLSSTAAALGEIADPAAIPALAKLVAAPGDYNDRARPAAAQALASCLAAAPPALRELDDAVLAAMLETIRERNDGEINAELHFAYGRIARELPPARRDAARRKLQETETARDDELPALAREAALVLASPHGLDGVDAETAAKLRARMHASLTQLAYDHDYTVRNLRIALRVAEAMPELVAPADLVWLTRFAEPDLRARAHALLERIRHPLPAAPVFDPRTARQLSDADLVRYIGEEHVVGRASLIAEAGRRSLDDARAAIIQVTLDVIERAPEGSRNLLDPDTHILEAAVHALRDELDDATIGLFDRMLRHSNYHVKWELLQDPPPDDRLIPGMFFVVGQRWGWQEKTAKEWLRQFAGTPAYEEARKHVGAPPLPDADDGDEDDAEDDPEDGDDDVDILGDDEEDEDDDDAMN